jgi:hypothetical protein
VGFSKQLNPHLGVDYDACNRAVASTILSVVYDLPEILSLDDSIIQSMNELPEEAIKAILPGAYLVEFFPWMVYIPSFLAKWKRHAQARFEHYSELFGGLFRGVEKRIVSRISSL